MLTTGIITAEYHTREDKGQEGFPSNNKFSDMDLHTYCSISIHYSIRVFRHYSDWGKKKQINEEQPLALSDDLKYLQFTTGKTF